MFVILFMLFIVALTLFPYLNVLAKAFNDSADAAKGGIKLWPRKFTLENFKQMLSDKNIYHALYITVARVVLVTIGALLVQFMTAYALTRKLKGTALFNIFFLIPMFITGGTMASFVLYKYIGLLNNFWVYVLPGLFTFYNVIVIRSYIQTSIPESIIEAAHIDGISELGLFFKIILPLSKPILATVALWVMVANWNDWTTTLYFASRNKDLETLQYKLMQTIQKSAQLQKDIKAALIEGGDVEAAKKAASKNIPPETMKSTQIIIVTVPIIMVYPFIQKYFTKGITLGAVKG
ncbi:MAG: carbohydrate ABC transporter permease [Clostridia bacterium]|nr:carbohydrate ABC transporter permease [Clostridia bacterium]